MSKRKESWQGITWYHGTKSQFDEIKAPAYFTSEKQIAGGYAKGESGGRLIESNLDIKNPKIIKSPRMVILDKDIRLAKSQGYDSIVQDIGEGQYDAIVFESTQVKSHKGRVRKGKWAQENKPKLVGIEWRSKIGEKFDPKEGGLVEAKVSDWEQKDKSTASGRDIVHVYLIEGTDGRVKPYGKQTAMKELGIVEPSKLDKQATELIRKQRYDEGQRKARVDDYKSRVTHGSVADANRAFLAKLPHQTAMDDMKRSSVYEKDGKYLTTLTDNEEYVIGAGYKKVRDNGSPIKVEFKTGGWSKGKVKKVVSSPKADRLCR